MTAVVDALEARNWVKRVRNERDRRSVFLVITPEGRATVNQIAPRLREVERHVMSVLTPDERRQLTSLLDRVLARASDLSSGAQSPRAAQRTGGGAR
jgi:DNA-binding MarR family transcriptional regulator